MLYNELADEIWKVIEANPGLTNDDIANAIGNVLRRLTEGASPGIALVHLLV